MTTHLSFQNFCVLGIWAETHWVLCIRVFHGYAHQGIGQSWVSYEGSQCWQNSLSEGFLEQCLSSQLTVLCSVNLPQMASCFIKACKLRRQRRVNQQDRIYTLSNITMKVASHFCAIVYLLKTYHRFHLYSRERDYIRT